jgi:hypothetical protein
MLSAARVADRFRELGGGVLTPLQLLKLVYISHGWSFPINNTPLLDQSRERIEAWQYGPVVPDLYHKLRSYRADPVTAPIYAGGPAPSLQEDQLLQAVFATYGRYSGGQLSSMTHQPGTPWDIAWKRGKNSQITDQMIEEHYRSLALKRGTGRA